ncbi:hypothetical protein cyc_05778 [Cyclospora cayetanensis]|uniref:Uncharacterized protein n=1 Tax=Cyclospora cayetanensis TaxID=88456 RepID=A0A1D3D8Z6_9EIME|nr:hypothetical protein cyc_05778 [Cyclospora cayetanensis]
MGGYLRSAAVAPLSPSVWRSDMTARILGTAAVALQKPERHSLAQQHTARGVLQETLEMRMQCEQMAEQLLCDVMLAGSKRLQPQQTSEKLPVLRKRLHQQSLQVYAAAAACELSAAFSMLAAAGEAGKRKAEPF